MVFHEPRGFIIGRAAGADFRLSPDDPYVSRRHVFLEICPPGCRLRDLGSTNSPHVNGLPVTEGDLNDGDIVELGYTQLRVSISVQSSTHVQNCISCGQPIELLKGELQPDRCPECVAKPSTLVESARAAMLATCASCGADLSEQANNDGRAEELSDVAIYACENCLSSADHSAGSLIADYEIRALLGEGGMGVVYLVYHRATARVLALKQLRDLGESMLIKRFEREIRLQKGLIHKNILRSIDTGIDGNGAPYLVTEYVPHGSLEDEVARCEGKLEARQAIHVIREVLEGLEYLHSQSIIHRDIKPQNILLRQADTFNQPPGWPSPKLADFGLAVSYARAGGTRLTRPRTGMGTLMFMPPEQVRDAGKVREPADTYAVGVMLYYLLTGSYTFDFPTPADVLEFQKEDCVNKRAPQEALRALMQLRRIAHPFNIILSEEPTPIRDRDPSIPRKLADVVDRAVLKDVKARFQSAAELRIALQEAAQ
jgi:serine/threonine protein kinase